MEKKHEEEIFHAWNHAGNLKRINGFYGRVVNAQDREIIKLIEGKRILDVGAGYGLLTKKLGSLGYEATGIEPDPEMVEFARRYFSVELSGQGIYQTDFPDGYFDTVILREVLPHLDLSRALKEINRIGKGTVIIFDSALQPLLRLARAALGHREYNQRTLDYYVSQLEGNGYKICVLRYTDVVALVMSGGYIGPVLVPDMDWAEWMVLAADGILNDLLKIAGLQRFFCWRFILKAKKI